MARSARRPRRAAAAPSLRDFIRAGPSSTVEGLAFVVLGVAVGLGFGLSAAAREWAVEALGFGWIPAGIFLAAAFGTLRYHRRSFRAYWRWWVVAATVATTSIGAISLFHAGDGILVETSLSGRWGQAVGGTPVAVALGKLAAICLIVPLLLFPRPVGSTYLRSLRLLGEGVQFVPVYMYLGLTHGAYYLDRRLRWLLNGPRLRRWAELAWTFMVRLLPSKLRDRVAGPAETVRSTRADSEPTEAASLWADTEPGTVPDWSLSESFDPPQTAPQIAAAASSNGRASKWGLPPIDVLTPAEPRTGSEAPLEQMARHIESTLGDHGVMVEVTDIKAGPRIIRFGLVPGWITKRSETAREEAGEAGSERSRVKVQSILMREKDLALALQTPYLRIEAPVPGEALVGLEVPSPSPSKVHLREVMESSTFSALAARGGLPIAMGQDTGGAPVVMDLTAMPHMLIAGATGSGKSVCINSIVASLLLTKPPEQLRMLMVDPKRVELTPFNGIPHLMAPVIVDVDQVNTGLRGLMREMLRRYKQMEEIGARNIAGYNNRAGETLPYLVLIVDELADLMIAGGFEVEQNLVRLAQLGRATGIHLVLATQRPSVNVVTGLLKANVPARAAFAVASQVDSRVILDAIGAEKLLGKGDMLLLQNDSPKPRRVQGTLVYDGEIDQLVEHWVNQKGPPLPSISMGEDDGENETDDEVDERMLEQARDLAVRHPHLSPSFLERRLKIGGWRATHILGLLEEEGLVVPR